MLRLALLLAVFAGVVACTSQGPSRLQPDRFDYNQAIARSTSEQMLLNLVRLRYSEIPVFLAVSSVLTQYSYAGTLGIGGSGGASLGEPLWQAGADANYVYIERPTITYTPLAGGEFAAQLLKPIPPEMVFSLVSSGWPLRQLLLMSLYRLNNQVNMAFEPSPEAFDRLSAFGAVVDQIIELARRNAVEVQQEVDNGDRYLVFDERPDAATGRLIDELKHTLDLDASRSRFRLTGRNIGRQPDELTVRVRSILELMGFLSRGVDLPEADRGQALEAADEAAQRRIPLHVRSGPDRPADAFVAVRFRGSWFFIAQSDEGSKQAFGLLAYLFQMQSPQQPASTPLLTVPTG